MLDVVLADGFLDHVRETGAALKEQLATLAGNGAVFTGVRGRGLMLGLDCAVPNLDLLAALRENRLLALPADGNVLRMLPPLTVGAAEIDEACDALARACAAVES